MGVGLAKRGGIAVGLDAGVGVRAGTGVATAVGPVIAERVSIGVGVGSGPEHAASNTAPKAIVTNQRNSFPITQQYLTKIMLLQGKGSIGKGQAEPCPMLYCQSPNFRPVTRRRRWSSSATGSLHRANSELRGEPLGTVLDLGATAAGMVFGVITESGAEDQ